MADTHVPSAEGAQSPEATPSVSAAVAPDSTTPGTSAGHDTRARSRPQEEEEPLDESAASGEEGRARDDSGRQKSSVFLKSLRQLSYVLIAAGVALVVVSLLTRPPSERTLQKYFA